MKFNIFTFFIILSGTYTSVLCVRNQEELRSESLTSSVHPVKPPTQEPRDEKVAQGVQHGVNQAGRESTEHRDFDLNDALTDSGSGDARRSIQELSGIVDSSRSQNALSTEPRAAEAEALRPTGDGVTRGTTLAPGSAGTSGLGTAGLGQNRGTGELSPVRSLLDPLPSLTVQQGINPLPGPQGASGSSSALAGPPAPQPPSPNSVTTQAAVNPVPASGTEGNQTVPAAATPSADSIKETNVKGVLQTSLTGLQSLYDVVNTGEVAQAQANATEPAKNSVCESFKTNAINVCTATGQNSSAELFTLVNNYFRNNVCTEEHSFNQLFNTKGEFAYKLLENHLAQFGKKAPNQSTQAVYDKSVPLVKRLTELLKQAELALVSEKIKNLMEKKNLVLTSAICAVANADQNAMSSSEYNAGQVTLTLNEEDFIKETTDEFMKAYAPMVDLLVEFNKLVPQILDVFEDGFENKINNLISLANAKTNPQLPGAQAPALGAKGVSVPGVGAGAAVTVPGAAGVGATGGVGAPSSGVGNLSPGSAGARSPALSAPATVVGVAPGVGVGGAGAAPGLGVGTSVRTGQSMLQLLDEDNREVASVHGHPSLIQRFKSLLQIADSSDSAVSSTTQDARGGQQPQAQLGAGGVGVPSGVSPGGVSGVGNTSPGVGGVAASGVVPAPSLPAAVIPGQGAGSLAPKGPAVAGDQRVDVRNLNGLDVLSRTSTGGVSNVDHSQHQLATSGSLGGLPGIGTGLGSRGEIDVLATGSGPSGFFGKIKSRLQSLLSRGETLYARPQANGRKVRDPRMEGALLNEMMKHFTVLGIFKTNGGKIVGELDEVKIQALVRSNLLTLNDYDAMYNLIIGPQRSLHSIYTLMEHVLLSPDADEKVEHIQDSTLLEAIKKTVDPLEDLYEQLKLNAPTLTLRSAEIGTELAHEPAPAAEEESIHEHVNNRGNFIVVSNSSGLKLSVHNLLIKLTTGVQNLTARSGIKGTYAQTCFVILLSILVVFNAL